MNKQEAIEKIYTASWDDFNYKGLIVDVETVNKIIYQIDEPQKPVVPKFVAEWIVEAEKIHNNLSWVWFSNPVSDELNAWLKNHTETFMRAWLDGYTIEQERLYTVEIAGAILTKITRGRNIQYKMLPSEDVSAYVGNAIYTTELTEQEIKQKDKLQWQFAKDVEE